jgi:hypothetical protein
MRATQSSGGVITAGRFTRCYNVAMLFASPAPEFWLFASAAIAVASFAIYYVISGRWRHE